jgi:hypothetical protein
MCSASHNLEVHVRRLASFVVCCSECIFATRSASALYDCSSLSQFLRTPRIALRRSLKRDPLVSRCAVRLPVRLCFLPLALYLLAHCRLLPPLLDGVGRADVPPPQPRAQPLVLRLTLFHPPRQVVPALVLVFIPHTRRSLLQVVFISAHVSTNPHAAACDARALADHATRPTPECHWSLRRGVSPTGAGGYSWCA